MNFFNLIYFFIALSITNFIITAQKLELLNQSFHSQNDANKALNNFLKSEKIEKFDFNENKSVITVELKGGAVFSIVLIKTPILNKYFFISKEIFEIMKSRTSFEDLGSGNF